MIENYEITIIKTNPNDANFNMNKPINQIYIHIIKSTKKLLIDNLSELEFKSDHSIKSKCLKWIVKKLLPNYKE